MERARTAENAMAKTRIVLSASGAKWRQYTARVASSIEVGATAGKDTNQRASNARRKNLFFPNEGWSASMTAKRRAERIEEAAKGKGKRSRGMGCATLCCT